MSQDIIVKAIKIHDAHVTFGMDHEALNKEGSNNVKRFEGQPLLLNIDDIKIITYELKLYSH